MFRLANLRIFAQLFMVSTLSLACLVIVGLWGMAGLRVSNAQAEMMYNRQFAKLQLAHEALNTLQNIASLAPAYAASLNQTSFVTNLDRYNVAFNQIIGRYEALIDDEDEQSLFEQARQAYLDYTKAAQAILSARSGAEAMAVNNRILPQRVQSLEPLKGW